MVMKGLGWMCVAALLTAAVGACLPGTARAADPVGKFSVALRMGVSGFDMGAIDGAISRSNSRLASIPVSTTWKVPGRIHSGFGVAGDVSYDLTSQIRLGLAYGSMWTSSTVDFAQVISVKPRTSMILPRAFYRLPWRPLDNTSFRLFAGPIFLRNAETKIQHEETRESGKRLDSMTIKGSGTGIVGGVVAEYTLADRFTLALEGGYQQAKASYDSGSWFIGELGDRAAGNDDGDALRNDRDLPEESYLWGFLNERYRQPWLDQPPTVGEDLDMDFSGFLLHAALRVYLF